MRTLNFMTSCWKGIKNNINPWPAIRTSLIMQLAILALVSCKDDISSLGIEILPPGDLISTRCDTLYQADANTLVNRPILSNSPGLGDIGYYYDKFFGLTKASFMTQVLPPANIRTDTLDLDIKNVKLFIKVSSFFGDSNQTHNLLVYPLTDTISRQGEITYYSDLDMEGRYDKDSLLNTIAVNGLDSLLEINLPNSIGTHLLSADSANLHSLNKFTNYFKGFYLKSDQASTSNSPSGSIISLDLLSESSYLMIETEQENLYYRFRIKGQTSSFLASHVNLYEHVQDEAIVSDYAGGPADSLIFIQGTGGSAGYLELGSLKTFKDTIAPGARVAINSAHLTIKPSKQAIIELTEDIFPERLILYYSIEKDKEGIIKDFYLDKDKSYFDGAYRDSTNEYHFNMARHVQDYLDGVIPSPKVYIRLFYARSPKRVIINANEVELQIVYQKIQ